MIVVMNARLQDLLIFFKFFLAFLSFLFINFCITHLFCFFFKTFLEQRSLFLQHFYLLKAKIDLPSQQNNTLICKNWTISIFLSVFDQFHVIILKFLRVDLFFHCRTDSELKKRLICIEMRRIVTSVSLNIFCI